jgi:UDP-glucose 4-epimerase
MQRIAITGSSGYYGRKLIECLRRQAPHVRIFGCDVIPPRDAAPDEFVRLDIRNPELPGALDAFAPDTIVHLAFVVNPTHDDGEMRSINIDGTDNVFRAVRRLRPARFLMSSSATVYGCFPDNPVPADETWIVRARPNYRYSVDKTELEQQIAALARELPETAVSWTRPAIIYGPGVNNYLSRFILQLPLIVLLDGCDSPLQFVHEEDVAAATWRILDAGGRGPYNVGPPDWVQLSDIATHSGRRVISLPFWFVRCITTCWWGLRLPVFDFPVGLLYFLRYPWVAAPNRLERELGFRFQYSSLDTLRALLHSHGKLVASAAAEQPQFGELTPAVDPLAESE